jgi:NAD(P)-dependent dehydrogenase (short-subunit alcohol dehydrogenase family)
MHKCNAKNVNFALECAGACAKCLCMTKHLIIGASGGIGHAVAQTVTGDVTGLSRSRDGLDITDQAGVERIMAGINGPFDSIFVATGALVVNDHAPEKSVSAITAQGMMDQFAVNAIGPALLLRHASRLLPRDRRAVFAILSARVGSIGDNQIGGWTSYRAAKAALNQVIHTTAIELARTHPQAICVALHPGTVETPFTAKYAGRYKTVTAPEAAQNLVDVMDALTPDQSGGFFDYAGKAIPW